MFESLIEMFGHGKFMPHGFCLKWDPALVLLMVSANVAIALAYFAIPLALSYFVHKRRDLAYPWMFRLFGAFIVACGLTHVVKVLTIYYACYWLEAWIDAYTALISMTTAVLLWPLIPQALSLPSPKDLEKLNNDLRAARDRALEASKSKSVFVANISHELRTPLTALLGMNELLYATELTEDQKVLLGTADIAGKSLLSMVNDLLDLSRLEAGKLGIEISQMRIEPLIKEVINVFRVECAKKDVALAYSIDSKIPEELFGDPTRIKQVLTNLLANSVKFTSQGSIFLSAELTTSTDENLVIKFTVSDTGVGLSEDDKLRIFEPFIQASTDGLKHPGAGLGLAISALLVEMMEGDIAASSEGKEKGATFWFTVSLFKKSGGGRQVEEGPFPGKPLKPLNAHVLVAEDDRLLKKLAERQLEKLGCKYKIVDSGLQAISEWKTGEYSLILMDCNLPDMDGYSATMEIRKQETSTRIPIIAMTAGAMEGDRERCLSCGMDDYLSKPYTIRQLENVMKRWLSPDSQGAPYTVPSSDVGSASSCPPDLQIVSNLKSEWVDLPKLTKEMSQSELEKLVPLFCSNAQELIGKIEHAVSSSDAASISKLAHQLKGTSRIMHAKRMDAICLEIERCAKESDFERLKTQVVELKAALKETKDVVITLLRSQEINS